MRRDFDSLNLPPAIAAAHRRLPRRVRPKASKVENNYIAEGVASLGKRSGKRRRVGAKRGNANAVKTGAYTAPMRALRAEVWRLTRSTRVLLALRKTALALREG